MDLWVEYCFYPLRIGSNALVGCVALWVSFPKCPRSSKSEFGAKRYDHFSAGWSATDAAWPLHFEARGHVAQSCATDAGTASVGGVSDASVAHAVSSTALFEGVCLYICVGRLLTLTLGHLTYLWAYWAKSKHPLSSQLISFAFHCDFWVRLSDSSASIIDLHLEALGGLICCGFSCYSWWLSPPRRLGAAWRRGKCWWLFLASSRDLVSGLHLPQWSGTR
jgi:hypothetical protein